MGTTEDSLDAYPIATSKDVAKQVPVIDVAAIVQDASSANARNAVDDIAAACRVWGFFQVLNHGVSSHLIQDTWTQTLAFFAQPTAVKERYLRTRENPWGYYNNERRVIGVAEWHINADEPPLIDYNLEGSRDAGLFDANNPFRTSDHDPVIVGINP